MLPINLKTLLIASAVSGLICFGFWLVGQGEKNKVIEQQDQIIKDQNETSGIQKIQKQLVSNTAVNDDIDGRTEWMQFNFEERDRD